MAKRKVIIDDIASAADVSKTTVSRYLNGKFEYMSEETRERIRKIIESTNYRPNKLASSLKSSRSRQIGLLIADISNPISAILTKGISDVCSENGFSLIIYCTDYDLAKEKSCVENLLDQQVEGIIANPADYEKSSADFEGSRVPIVLLDRKVESGLFDTVVTNNVEATLETVNYLYSQGFRAIALFSEKTGSVSARRERLEAFERFYRKTYNREADGAVFIIDPSDPEKTKGEIMGLVKGSAGQIPAIFTASGVCMLSVLTAILQLGLKIPKDIAVCGYDDWTWTRVTTPGITAVSQPSYDVGVHAARRLIDRIEKRDADYKPVEEVLSSRLIVRGSTEFMG